MKKSTFKIVMLVILVVIVASMICYSLNIGRVYGENETEDILETNEVQIGGLYLDNPSFKYIKANSGLIVRGDTSSQAEEWDTLPYGAMVLASSEVLNEYCLIIYTKGTTDYSGYVDVNYLTVEEITPQMIEENRANLAKTNSVNNNGNLRYLGVYYITGYDTCARCCGKSDGITASGRIATVGRTVAMSGFAFGTRIYIEGIGYRVVEDRGVSAGKVDVLCGSHSECYAITGRYKVYIVE